MLDDFFFILIHINIYDQELIRFGGCHLTIVSVNSQSYCNLIEMILKTNM